MARVISFPMGASSSLASGGRAPLHEERATPEATSPDDDRHLFGIEKGFWKIHHAAQELLKFTTIYQEARDAAGPSGPGGLPKEIDMLSMTQLSWSVLHAVGDINNHSQRLAGRHDAAWVQQRLEPGSTSSSTKGCVKRPRRRRRAILAGTGHHAGNGCIECGAAESPCWRLGPAGPLTLCNVCGLLYAKRTETETLESGSEI